MTTTDALLARLRTRMRWPASGGPIANAALLEIMDEELQTSVFPMALKAREDYRVYHVDYEIQANVAEYRVPPRAHAGRLKDVQLLVGDAPISLPYIDLEQVAGQSGMSPSDRGRAFYFRDDWVGLWPTPKATRGTLRLYYYMRPGRLVLPSQCGRITSAEAITSTITVAELASTPVSGPPVDEESKLDVVSATGGFATLHADTSGQVFSSAEALFEVPFSQWRGAVGDYVCAPGDSPIPQIPEAAFPLLLARTAVVALHSLGDMQGAAVQQQLADRHEVKLVGLLANRVDGEAKIVSPDHSPLRQAGGYRRRWR